MRPLKLIDSYYREHSEAKRILLAHSRLVADLAVEVAGRVAHTTAVDILFIEQAALLHDIGIFKTDAPKIGCHGTQPYITHGLAGVELLYAEGLPRHALVCERHIGVGLTVEDIKSQQLPLPLRDMRPKTIEEEIVAYADLFFSKTVAGRRTPEKVRASIARFGEYKVNLFNDWHTRFGP